MSALPQIALIGDVHSQARPLEQALEFVRETGAMPVFLGDLFDSRCGTSETLAVYEFARAAQRDLGAVILNSNHQDKLRRYLTGGGVNLTRIPELSRTIREFDDVGTNRDELVEWLSAMPYGYIFRDSSLREYRAAHAYFPSWVGGPSTEAMGRSVLREDINSKARELMLYGKKDYATGKRVRWWEDDRTFPWVRVAGHYHCVHVSDSCLVLDGCCGNEGGRLPVFLVDSRELRYFG